MPHLRRGFPETYLRRLKSIARNLAPASAGRGFKWEDQFYKKNVPVSRHSEATVNQFISRFSHEERDADII